ncbi:hypothetical protein [Limosilactobacillus allomucosae]|uniref:hypothetical protein n=1 Tax=Limosilactobacillus allomucosae TaxID=3142938 RepID=UPI00326326CF
MRKNKLRQFKHHQKKKDRLEKYKERTRQMYDKNVNDQCNNYYKVRFDGDVILTDGTVLKDADVTKYTIQTVNRTDNKVIIEFDKDFLSKIDFTKSAFGTTSYLKRELKRKGDDGA